jgi:hypothetical protein
MLKYLTTLNGQFDLPSRVSSGAQVEHNKASENCFIAAMASGDVVLM